MPKLGSKTSRVQRERLDFLKPLVYIQNGFGKVLEQGLHFILRFEIIFLVWQTVAIATATANGRCLLFRRPLRTAKCRGRWRLPSL